MKTKLFSSAIGILLIFLAIGCNKNDDVVTDNIDYKQKMRDFVINISKYAKGFNSNFSIIPQNGIEIVTTNGEEDGPINIDYVNAIDGHGQEDLFLGYIDDNQATLSDDNAYLRIFLDKSKNVGNTILVTDYCSTQANMDDSYSQNGSAGYVSFAADQRELNNIPDYPGTIYNENNAVITDLSEVKNFLYLINPENYSLKSDFINAVTSTNYDLLIMDLYFHDGSQFSSTEIDQLKSKANGGKRMVVSYMSIGEAEDYRYYWQTSWNSNKPSWLDAENPDWPGNFKVKYWDEEWQAIIFGNDKSYLKKIIDANFDGVYLDIIEAYEFYE